MADDSHDTKKGTETDDLESFGTLNSPDTQDSGLVSEAVQTEADLTSLAASAKANQNGHPEPLSTDDESRVDLSQAAETLGEETLPIQEAASERIEQPSDTPPEQTTPIANTDVRERSEPERADASSPKKSRKHWVLVLSIGFILGLTTASISIFIFISTDRFQSNAPLSSASSPIVPNQRVAMSPRISQPRDSSNAQSAPSQSARPRHGNKTLRPVAAYSENSVSIEASGRRKPTSVRMHNRARRPIDQRTIKRLVEKPTDQPISASQESANPSAQEKPADRTTSTGVVSTGKSPQSAETETANLDKIIDRVLDATEEENIKRSVARKKSQKNAPQPPKKLPLAPSREQVTEAMAVLLPAIRGCAKGLSGLATANIIVLNTGKVASVTVSGSPFEGTASGQCIEGVVRKARFPRFRQPSFRIRFPFSIRNVSE